tara:strand:+ start:27 stop:518 length:492 start_codon:yes stop_codon:yes gene_type:complete
MEVQTTTQHNIQKSSKEQLLKNLTPEKLIKHDVKMKDLVLNSKNLTTVGSLKRNHGSNFSNAILMGWLIYFNKLVNQKKSMTEDQISITATFIEEDYYWLSFQDIALIFKNIMKGNYGKLYESFDTLKLMDFFKTYAGQRIDLAEELQINRHNELKHREKWDK